MSAPTPSELLAAVNKAIIAILEGNQEARVLSRTYRKADLETLWKMRSELEAEVASEGGSGMRVRQIVMRG